MKYKLTPFHFVALWLLYQTAMDIRINAILGDQAGLGGLFPLIDIALLIGTLLIDLLIQFVFSTYFKADWKLLYLTQLLIIALVFIISFPTVQHVG